MGLRPTNGDEKPLHPVIPSIHSLGAAHGEQKLGSSLKLGHEAWESWEDAVRQL